MHWVEYRMGTALRTTKLHKPSRIGLACTCVLHWKNLLKTGSYRQYRCLYEKRGSQAGGGRRSQRLTRQSIAMSVCDTMCVEVDLLVVSSSGNMTRLTLPNVGLPLAEVFNVHQEGPLRNPHFSEVDRYLLFLESIARNREGR
jgi:hypothetical protein